MGHPLTPSLHALGLLSTFQILEQTDESAIQRRYMTLETIAPLSDDPDMLPALAVA
jgi:hypothetical protein